MQVPATIGHTLKIGYDFEYSENNDLMNAPKTNRSTLAPSST